jgi:hypothetical protein
MKKVLALTFGVLILGFAFAAAQDKSQTQAREESQVKAQLRTQVKAQTQTKAQARSEFRHRNRIAFIDENGDGINDLAKDHDGDGIPNGQDPDWARPGDGTGYKAQHKISKGSFRTGMQGAARAMGAGVCDGTGPKGTAQRKGRR